MGWENSRKLCKPESTNFKSFEAAGTPLELDGSQINQTKQNKHSTKRNINNLTKRPNLVEIYRRRYHKISDNLLVVV